MKMTYTNSTSCLLALLLFVALQAATPVVAQTFDFDGSLEGWQQQWHKESSTGTDGVVSLDSTLGFDDSWSLKFDMGDGLGDDGTLWIERAFPAPSGTPVNVDVAFELFSVQQSDFNQFQVKAFAGATDPNVQADFTTIGSTDTVAGWASYEHHAMVVPSHGDVWIAVGVRVAWETPRDYWIDHVTVTVPEPASGGAACLAACLLALCTWRGLGNTHREL